MLDEMQRSEAHKHFQRGLILEQAGRFDEAVEEYRQAVAYDPHLREAHDALAAYYHRQGLLAKAADELRIVATLDEDAVAYYNLGSMLAELGRYEAARQALRRCLELDPADQATRIELAYVDYACKRYGEAAAALSALLPDHAEDWEVHNLLGLCLLRLGQYDEARASFCRAQSLTQDVENQDELSRNIVAVERHAEFRRLRGMKDRLYAEEGVICLGSARDDGLKIPEYEQYHFSYEDVATTISRFISLACAMGWGLTAVVAADRAARPVAQLLGRRLQLPLREPAELGDKDNALLVGGVVREAEFLDVAADRLVCNILWFCQAITWQNHPTIAPPHTVGIIAREATLPWSAELGQLLRQGAPRSAIGELVGTATLRLAKVLEELPEEPLRRSQVRYYTHRHRKIDFA